MVVEYSRVWGNTVSVCYLLTYQRHNNVFFLCSLFSCMDMGVDSRLYRNFIDLRCNRHHTYSYRTRLHYQETQEWRSFFFRRIFDVCHINHGRFFIN